LSGEELRTKTDPQHWLLLRKNSPQQIDFLGKKWVAGIRDVRDSHGPTHDDQDIAAFQGGRCGRPSIEPNDFHPKPTLLA
jgi:hypothetical protein